MGTIFRYSFQTLDRKAPPPEGGFTLVEAVMATTVLSLSLLGAIATLLSIANLNAIAEEKNFAILHAKKMMEQVRATQFDQIRIKYIVNPPFPHFEVPGLKPQAGDADNCVGRLTVVKGDGGTNNNFFEVTVEVKWKGKYADQEIIMQSMIAKTKQ